MPTEVAPGIFYWSRAEIGLPPSKASGPVRKTEYWQHYSTGQELGRSDALAWWREIYQQHLRQGWVDLGYNFGAANDANDPQIGHVLEGRGWDKVGAHCPGQNTEGLGACFLGNDDPGVSDASPGALRALLWIYEEGGRRHGRTLVPFGHKEGRATACPGHELFAEVKASPIFPGARGAYQPAPQPTPVQPTPVQPPVERNGTGLFKKAHTTQARGSRSAQHVQELVGVKVDGIFGPDTEKAVKAMQRARGLGVDGIVGPQSWAQFHPVLRAGDVHERVKEIQREVGVGDDGHFGPKTESAVRGYQRGKGLKSDGIVGPQTYGKMLA